MLQKQRKNLLTIMMAVLTLIVLCMLGLSILHFMRYGMCTNPYTNKIGLCIYEFPLKNGAIR